MFKGSNVALITPFKNNKLDVDAYIKLRTLCRKSYRIQLLVDLFKRLGLLYWRNKFTYFFYNELPLQLRWSAIHFYNPSFFLTLHQDILCDELGLEAKGGLRVS